MGPSKAQMGSFNGWFFNYISFLAISIQCVIIIVLPIIILYRMTDGAVDKQYVIEIEILIT